MPESWKNCSTWPRCLKMWVLFTSLILTLDHPDINAYCLFSLYVSTHVYTHVLLCSIITFDKNNIVIILLHGQKWSYMQIPHHLNKHVVRQSRTSICWHLGLELDNGVPPPYTSCWSQLNLSRIIPINVYTQTRGHWYIYNQNQSTN